jgi:hypothetical protein
LFALRPEVSDQLAGRARWLPEQPQSDVAVPDVPGLRHHFLQPPPDSTRFAGWKAGLQNHENLREPSNAYSEVMHFARARALDGSRDLDRQAAELPIGLLGRELLRGCLFQHTQWFYADRKRSKLL